MLLHRPILAGVLPAFLLNAAPLIAQEHHTPTSITAPAPTSEAKPEFSLAEVVRLALQNNPQIEAVRQTELAAKERARAARTLPNPTLQLVPGLGNVTARDEEVILAQPLDLFGQRGARSRFADAEGLRANAQTITTRQRLVFEVRTATIRLFTAQENLRLTEAGLQIAEAFFKAADRRAQLGETAPVQTQRARLEMLRLQNETVRIGADLAAKRAVLNGWLARDPQTPIRVTLPLSDGLLVPFDTGNSPAPATTEPDSSSTSAADAAPTVTAGASLDANLVGGRTLDGRGDLSGARATLETRRAQLGVARASNRPAFELQARRSSFFGREGDYGLRAVITAPLFDLGANRGEKRALEAEIRAQEATVRGLEIQARAEVEATRLEVESGRLTVKRYRTELVPLALELLRKTQIGFDTGASNALELLEAQRALRGVQAEYLEALSRLGVSETELENALGLAIVEATP